MALPSGNKPPRADQIGGSACVGAAGLAGLLCRLVQRSGRLVGGAGCMSGEIMTEVSALVPGRVPTRFRRRSLSWRDGRCQTGCCGPSCSRAGTVSGRSSRYGVTRQPWAPCGLAPSRRLRRFVPAARRGAGAADLCSAGAPHRRALMCHHIRLGRGGRLPGQHRRDTISRPQRVSPIAARPPRPTARWHLWAARRAWMERA